MSCDRTAFYMKMDQLRGNLQHLCGLLDLECNNCASNVPRRRRVRPAFLLVELTRFQRRPHQRPSASSCGEGRGSASWELSENCFNRS
jgi:hypothetical protein